MANIELDERIAELWKRGLSSTTIGKDVGATRNAVMGRVHRMRAKGLLEYARRQPRSCPTREIPAREIGQVVKPAKGEPLVIKSHRFPLDPHSPWHATIVTAPPPENTPVFVWELETNHCRYIAGDVGKDSDILYCGAPIHKQSFCLHHHQLCYMPYKRGRTKVNTFDGKSSFGFGNSRILETP